MHIRSGVRQNSLTTGLLAKSTTRLQSNALAESNLATFRRIGDCYASGNSDPLAGVNAVHDECEGKLILERTINLTWRRAFLVDVSNTLNNCAEGSMSDRTTDVPPALRDA
jgi:ethanolamine ammonia-lyase large subunit